MRTCPHGDGVGCPACAALRSERQVTALELIAEALGLLVAAQLLERQQKQGAA